MIQTIIIGEKNDIEEFSKAMHIKGYVLGGKSRTMEFDEDGEIFYIHTFFKRKSEML